MSELGDYLKQAAASPWEWGHHDCCTFFSGWVIQRGNPDPMAFMRGAYDSAVSAMRRIMEAGGLVELGRHGMDAAGVAEVATADAGDVAVIAAPTSEGINEACAIYTGERWASLTAQGLEFGPATPLVIWRP